MVVDCKTWNEYVFNSIIFTFIISIENFVCYKLDIRTPCYEAANAHIWIECFKIRWFFEQYINFFNSKTNGNTNCPEGNPNGCDNYEEIANNDKDSSNLSKSDSFKSSAEGFLKDGAYYGFGDVDFNKLIRERLMDLTEHFNVTKAVTFKISELLMDIIQIDC